MSTLYEPMHYWLVDHPSIIDFEWDTNRTIGASTLFPTLSVSTYLTITFLLHRFRLLPTIPSATLRLISALHSFLLCFLSLIMATGSLLSILHQTPPNNLTWSICFPIGHIPRRGPIFFWGHVFYLSKILEFIDTLLILLSESRSRRLTFLHVYHHAAVVVICYVWLAAPQSMFPEGVILNSSVHVLMYAYYFLSAMGRRPTWKKMVTNCQIMQFRVLPYVVSIWMFYLHFTGSRGCAGVLTWIISAAFSTSLLILFRNFHVKNYPTSSHGKTI